MYLNHDFYKNMVAAVKSGDLIFVTSLFVNELSDLVVFEKGKLTGVLNKTGVKVNAGISNQDVVTKTLDALPKNLQLQKGIAFLFAEINGLINNNKGNATTWKQTIDDIAKGVTLVAKKLAQPGSYAASVKTDVMQLVQSKKSISGQSNADGETDQKPGWSTRKKVFVFGGIALVLFFGIRYIRKNMVSDAANVPAAPLPAPVATTPPIPNTPPVATPLPNTPPVPPAQATITQPVGTPQPVPQQ